MTTDLVTADTYDFDSAEELAQVWLEESDGDFTPEFPRIKAKGGVFDFGQDLAPSREARGVIVAWHKSSRLYLEEFGSSDENKRPDAWSTDGKVQIIPAETFEKIDEKNAERQAAGRPLLPYPSRDLASCPYNRFAGDFPTGTTPLGSTSGKDNNEYRELFIVLAGAESVVPYQLSIPATSLKAWDGRGGYANGLITKGIRLSTVETVITAASTKVGANEFTTFTFSRGGKLAPDVKDKARAYAVGVQDFVKRDPFAVARAATNELAAPEQPALAAPVQEPVQEAVQEAVQEPVAPTEPATVPVEAPAVQEPVAVAVGSADDIEF